MTAASRQRRAFAAYLDLGPTRSLAKLHALLRAEPARHGFTRAPSLRTLDSWSTQFRWAEEIESIERRALQEEEQEHIERVKAYHARLRQEGLLLQQKGIGWLSAKDAEDVRTHEAIRAVAEGFRLEALGLGEVTERIALEDTDDRLERLSDEELDRLIRAARASETCGAD